MTSVELCTWNLFGRRMGKNITAQAQTPQKLIPWKVLVVGRTKDQGVLAKGVVVKLGCSRPGVSAGLYFD